MIHTGFVRTQFYNFRKTVQSELTSLIKSNEIDASVILTPHSDSGRLWVVIKTSSQPKREVIVDAEKDGKSIKVTFSDLEYPAHTKHGIVDYGDVNSNTYSSIYNYLFS